MSAAGCQCFDLLNDLWVGKVLFRVFLVGKYFIGYLSVAKNFFGSLRNTLLC